MPVRRRPLLATSALLILALSGCGAWQRKDDASAAREALAQRQALERQRCQLRWRQIQPQLAHWNEQRTRLAAVEAEGYRPGPGRPTALDPEEQRRLATYDQEIEQEQYQQALEAWREKERARHLAWSQEHATRLQRAKEDLQAAADGLQTSRLSELKRCAMGS